MRKIWLLSLALLLLLPPLFFISLKIGLATPLLNFALKKELAGLFNGEVRFGLFRTDLISYVEVSDLMVLTGRAGAKLPVLTASSIRLNYSLIDALRGKRSWEDAVELAAIKELKLFLIRDKKGNWNIREVLKLPASGKKARPAGVAGAMLATRLVLEDSTVIFNDELKGFQSTMDKLEGTLDARAFPLIVFSMSGRTEGHRRDNLSLAGEWNAEEESVYARADLERVPLKTYLNYVLPSGGLKFEDGNASLSVRAVKAKAGAELDFSGRADVEGGGLKIPGISQPLKNFQGSVAFNRDRLNVKGVRADFLGSTWLASGDLEDLHDPRLNLQLQNQQVPLSELSQQISGLSLLSLSGTAALNLSVTGQVKDPKVNGHVNAALIRIEGIDLSQVDAEVELDRAGLKVPGIQALLWGGAVKGSAEIRFPDKHRGTPGSLSGNLKGQDIQLGQWSYAGKNYLPIQGSATLDAKVSGAIRTPDVDAVLESPQASLGKQALGRFQAKAALRGRQLNIDLKTWDGHLDGQLSLVLANGAHFGDSRLSLKGLSLQQLSSALSTAPDSILTTPDLRQLALSRLSRLSGGMDAEILFSGAFRRPDLSAKFLSRDVRLKIEEGFWKQADKKGLPIAVEGTLRMKDGQLYFGALNKPFHLSVGGGKLIALGLSGPSPMKNTRRPQQGEQDLKISLVADLGFLEGFENFSRASGKAVAEELRLGGSLDSLTAEGLLEIKDFSAKMKQGFSEIKHGEAQIGIKGQSLELYNLSFDSGGSINASGNLDFSSGAHPYGKLELRTDSKGLRLDNFAGMIDASVVVEDPSGQEPMTITFAGLDGTRLKGKLKLHDAVFKLTNKAAAGREDPSAAPQHPSTPGPPLDLDLRVEIDDNVWLNKLEDEVDPFNLTALPGKIFDTVMDNLRAPPFEFRFKPTTEDFVVRGTIKDLRLKGKLGIDRGDLHFQENDFHISQQDAGVIFSGGRRGDVMADAKTQVRYYVNNPTTGRQEPKAVEVTVQVRPLSEEELSKSGLENAFLNYKLIFSSEPKLEENAILSLLVLGVPIDNSTAPGSTSQSQDGQQGNLSQIFTKQASKLSSGFSRKVIRGFAKYLKGFGSHLVDYFRVAPKLSYQRSSGNSISTEGGSKVVSQQIQQSSGTSLGIGWLFEVGKSFYSDFFLTGQVVVPGEDSINAAKTQNVGPVGMEVSNSGARAAVEYHIAPTRMFEASWSYGVDENLEPFAYNPYSGEKCPGCRYYFGFRNTIPTANYSPRLARERQRAQMEKKEAKP
jgi:hypothetical protein